MLKLRNVLAAISLAAAFFALAACGGGTTTSGNAGGAVGDAVTLSPDNPIELTALIVTNQMAPAPGNRITEALRERLGVTLVYDILAPDQQDQRIGVMLAAGAELPDLVGVTDLNARLVQGGALLRLDPFLDSGNWPRLAEHIAPVRARLTWTGGGVEDGIYQIPNYNRFYGDPPIMSPTHFGTAFWLQKSVLEWHGFPDLSNMTLDRYFDLIEEYMAAHPTIDGMPTIGFTFPFMGRPWGLTNPPMFLAGFPNNGGVIVREGGIAELYAGSQYAQDFFRFLNQAFLRGLVDPESFTRTVDDYLAALATGRVLGMHDQRWAFGTSYDALVSAGRYERTWVSTTPTFPGRTPWYADRPVLNVNQGFGIAADAENPELILSFIEALLDPEIQILLSWGIAGEDFMIDTNGEFYRTPEQRANANDITWVQHNRLEALLDIMPKMQGTLPDGNAFAPGDQPREFLDGVSDYNRFFLESYGKSTWMDFTNDPPPNPVYYPAWQISMPDGSAAQLANAQLEEAALMHLPRIVMAAPGEFDALWQEYLDFLALIDTAAVEAVITQGLQERIAAGQ